MCSILCENAVERSLTKYTAFYEKMYSVLYQIVQRLTQFHRVCTPPSSKFCTLHYPVFIANVVFLNVHRIHRLLSFRPAVTRVSTSGFVAKSSPRLSLPTSPLTFICTYAYALMFVYV